MLVEQRNKITESFHEIQINNSEKTFGPKKLTALPI